MRSYPAIHAILSKICSTAVRSGKNSATFYLQPLDLVNSVFTLILLAQVYDIWGQESAGPSYQDSQIIMSVSLDRQLV
jgi:hypothetical protein